MSYVTHNSHIANLTQMQKAQIYSDYKKKIKNQSKREACRNLVKENNLNQSPKALLEVMRRMEKNSGKTNGCMSFSASTEQLFVGILEGFSLLNRPLTRGTFLTTIVANKVKKRGIDLSGWFKRFLDRHKANISEKALKGIKSNRVSESQPYYANEFAEVYEKIIINNNFGPENIFNCDETKVTISPNNSHFKAITCNFKHNNTTIIKENKKWATFVPFHSCNRVVIAFLILPFTKKNKATISLKRHDHYLRSYGPKLFYTFNQSGCINIALWKEMLNLFKAEINNLFPNKRSLLLLDNLNVHVNTEVLQWSMKNNIQMLFFPKYSSSYIQPSDDLLFLSLKKHLRAVYRQRIQAAHDEQDLAVEMAACITDALRFIIPSDLEPSWRHTGLVPFNKALILENEKNCCGKISLENQSTITNEAMNATIEVIQRSLGSSNSVLCHDFQPTKTFYTAEEIYNEKKRKEDERQTCITKSKRKRTNDNDVAVETYISNKKQRVSPNLCFFKDHNIVDQFDPRVYKGRDYCDICKEYFLCKKCFTNVPEVLLSHERNCAFISSKINKMKKELEQEAPSKDVIIE